MKRQHEPKTIFLLIKKMFLKLYLTKVQPIYSSIITEIRVLLNEEHEMNVRRGDRKYRL